MSNRTSSLTHDCRSSLTVIGRLARGSVPGFRRTHVETIKLHFHLCISTTDHKVLQASDIVKSSYLWHHLVLGPLPNTWKVKQTSVLAGGCKHEAMDTVVLTSAEVFHLYSRIIIHVNSQKHYQTVVSFLPSFLPTFFLPVGRRPIETFRTGSLTAKVFPGRRGSVTHQRARRQWRHVAPYPPLTAP